MGGVSRLLSSLAALFKRNGLFALVDSGIQFWVTEFLVSVLHFQKLSVVALSTFCFLTAPTSGYVLKPYS